MKRPIPIRVGDKFKGSKETYTVTEAMPFGRGYWVITEDRNRQTIFDRNTLETMQRVSV